MEIKGLIEELMNGETLSDVSEVTEKLFSAIENVNTESGSQKVEIEESAVNLWNWTVARKTGPAISDVQRVKLRHAACKLMVTCDASNPSEDVLRRQILMAMKTGRGWLDVGNATLADELLEVAMKSVERLYAQLAKRSTSEADTHSHKADVEKDVFRVLSYQAESAVIQGSFQKATACVQRCKDILMRLPRETCYLSLLCYNFGVETYELKRHEQSCFWLSQSYEIGKMDKKYSTGKEMQAKVLRLLATVYLEWDLEQYQDRALRAINMANEENLHPAGFFLKIKILLKAGALDKDVGTAAAELLHHGFSLDICLDTAKLLLEYEREATCFSFLKSVAQLFAKSPDVGKVILLHIELLLQRMKEPLAKTMIESIIAGHSTGMQLPPEILNRLHLVLWDRAAKNYEAKNYSETLQWYRYSLSFYSSGQTDCQNLAKLHRNMAACYLHLKEFDKAKEAVKEAERHNSNGTFTQFYVYKIAVLENNTQKASDALIAMEESAAQSSQCEDRQLTDRAVATSLMGLAAQFALENDQQPVAIKALGYLSQHLQDCQQALAALKCLIRLVLSKAAGESKEEVTEDMKMLLTYLTAARHRLEKLFREGNETLEARANEAQWFRKIAWNLAVQCESCPSTRRDLFVRSLEFSQFCPPDKAVQLAQRTCLLMAAAIELDMGRSAVSPADQQTKLLVQALEHVQSCREIWKGLKQTGEFPRDPTDALLLLYEFEARAKLNDTAVASLLDQVWELPQLESKTLETLASLSMEAPAHYPSLCKRALKMLLTLLRKQDAMDVVTLSKCLHSLVHLSLPAGVIEAGVHALEEAWGYFEEALSVLGSPELQAGYPEVEIVWLMTRAWNAGIQQLCGGGCQEAEQWCGLGMRFLAHLGSLKSTYEEQMIGLYGEVLNKLDRPKGRRPKEE
ncbi:testis-expressed protein 11 [Varanus komodoensis]|uniref:testis-expressed protein 11 n=1 Tax=Varanus komodoensis TaxID=61221 RepID=UPI001CF7D752|nr:testis-expressed protein 11 [Varanus komodoensis]